MLIAITIDATLCDIYIKLRIIGCADFVAGKNIGGFPKLKPMYIFLRGGNIFAKYWGDVGGGVVYRNNWKHI
jgi:hypothetical protein